ncbi:MAG: LytTR family DNA-binding domain-containing protein [Erysipelotrichaceae bacterium]|nr:LytTR family DNA-binding domain-containing protein [Erysipelotrichaceae bacterium]
MKIKCCVIDDDSDDLNKIRNNLYSICVSLKFELELDFYSSPKDESILNTYDLYILDIDMPDINGFKLANSIFDVNRKAVVMFCSSHEDFVFDSFRLNAFYFIRKSFLEDDLILAMKKYIRTCDALNNSYIISSKDITTSIPYNEIIYFEVVSNYIYIHTSHSEIKERKTLKKLEEELINTRFIRIDQNFIVNCDYINSISEDTLYMKNDIVLKIPKRNLKEVTEKYYTYLSR